MSRNALYLGLALVMGFQMGFQMGWDKWNRITNAKWNPINNAKVKERAR